MNTTIDNPAEPQPLSEYAAHIKRTMTADQLYAFITDMTDDSRVRIPAKQILEMADQILANAVGPQGD